MIRRQLPAVSPVSLPSLLAAGFKAVRSPDEARTALVGYLKDRFNADYVILTGSGTQALQLALEVARDTVLSPSKLVALPAYSCYDLVSAAVGADVSAAFYDVDPLTLSVDEVSLRGAVSAGARAVVGANLFGFPVDWSLLRDIAKSNEVLLIEDASQGLGSSWGELVGGSLGDMTVLSFGRGKGWTGGGGGALLVRFGGPLERLDRSFATAGGRPDPGLDDNARAFVTCLALWALARPRLYGVPASIPGLGLGETVYRQPRRVSSIPAYAAAAALAFAQPSRSAVEGRRSWAARWARVLDDLAPLGGVSCTPLDGGDAGYLRYPLLIEDELRRSDFVSACRTAGVAGGYPMTLPDLVETKRIWDTPTGSTPGACRLARSLLTLPTHAAVSEVDLGAVVQALSRSTTD